ncbi:type VI secretion system tube protein TssD [Larkinella sp. VNQ87]|uniref:type VI secretion system tube protein TssD n=1 Tax=Larkinella sp. VNQ87 TaxID=3400921 RepID=UPI003C05099D
MSFKATLTVEGKKFDVLQCTHTLVQKYQRGRTTSGVRGGVIILILDGTDDDLLGNWVSGTTVKKNGEIVFDRVDQRSSLQKLEFEDAYATFYFEFMSRGYIDQVDAMVEVLQETISVDITKENEYEQRVINNTVKLLRFAERTRHSNCILIRLSAAKIKLDGIDHQNT